MAKKICSLALDVEYDDAKTDPEALAGALDQVLGTGLTTPGILDEYGEVDVGEFRVDLDRSDECGVPMPGETWEAKHQECCSLNPANIVKV